MTFLPQQNKPGTVHEKHRKAGRGEYHDITRHSSGKDKALQMCVWEEMAPASGNLLLQLRHKAERRETEKEVDRLHSREDG